MYDLFDKFTEILLKMISVLGVVCLVLLVAFVIIVALTIVFRMYVYWRGLTPTGATSVLYEYDTSTS